MVVLTELFHGLTLKRKGADDPELFDGGGGGDDRSSSGFPISCRATKMRRLACPDGGPRHHQDAPQPPPPAQDNVPMCDEPALASAEGEEEGALVLYGGRSDDPGARGVPRLALRADRVRAMLREADSRTVRELLAGAAAQEQGSDGLDLAVVPWVPPSAAEPSTAAGEAEDQEEGAAAMDVEEEDEAPGLQWTSQAYGCGNGGAGGLVYWWPQHCMAPPHMPAVAQPSPVMWSW
ncbi:hypothetical protein BAE44_0008868 [Dichanthelium oligosanthes]|uniref:Uncharacterized protein n=1 Tax=Dichanthelium oligosanthes TaxID=888268 RepID=A0A1E5VYE6_9POAL|nr:hypothetical protein BAE44_0008868 [Dichanthelium oligosanthes]